LVGLLWGSVADVEEIELRIFTEIAVAGAVEASCVKKRS